MKSPHEDQYQAKSINYSKVSNCNLNYSNGASPFSGESEKQKNSRQASVWERTVQETVREKQIETFWKVDRRWRQLAPG